MYICCLRTMTAQNWRHVDWVQKDIAKRQPDLAVPLTSTPLEIFMLFALEKFNQSSFGR